MTRIFECNTFWVSTIMLIIPFLSTAQFFTIQQDRLDSNNKIAEEAMYSFNIAKDTKVEGDTIKTILSQEDTKFSEIDKKELLLKIMYYDNETLSMYEELFLAYMNLAAQREKEKYGNGNFDYENIYDTDIKGSFRPATDLTMESLIAEIKKNNLAHPRVVLAQAILETGWFKSSVCRNYNNLFGLTNPRTKEYYRFSTWQESVTAYYTKVQYKYKGGNYLTWLRELGYAEDPDYTAKLRVLLDGPLAKYGY